jgi:thiol-disulfide isomerase/thioredoxin
MNKILSLLFLITANVSGQPLHYQNLSVGDSLPKFTFQSFTSGKRGVNFSADFRDKLVILDFWSVGCPSCIEALPEMEALQQKYKGAVEIFPVSYDKEKQSLAFLLKNKYAKNLSLPFVIGDTVFKQYFRHLSVPHEVWIYKGKVIAITGANYVDENNIAKILKGERINWVIKDDFLPIPSNKSIFDFEKVDSTSHFVSKYYSAINPYLAKFGSSTRGKFRITKDSIYNCTRYTVLNQAILKIYLANWSIINKTQKFTSPSPIVQPNQIVWEVKEQNKYHFTKESGYQEEWLRKNGICYELALPNVGYDDIQISKFVIDDLDKLLGLHVRWVKRKEHVFVLSKHSSTPRKAQNSNSVVDGGHVTTSSFVYMLNEVSTNPYVFNESGDEDVKIPTIPFTCLKKNLVEITTSLYKYGYDLKDEIRLVDKMIFTELP